MSVLLIALLSGLGFVVAYHTYGRWLGGKVFELSASAVCPSVALEDGKDFVPSKRAVVFGHHFTSIAGTGPIVGPAIAVIWGWGPALLWVVFGSIFIGAVHDFGSLVVSLRNRGQTVGDVAGRVLNKRVRVLFLLVLFMALTIVLAIFGLVIANVLKLYPSAIVPVLLQVPLAMAIGVWLHRKGADLRLPSALALVAMYATVVLGDWGPLAGVNAWLAGWPAIVWVFVLLGYGWVASVLPVWVLLQPRDFINSLQLLTALGLVLVGLVVAAVFGGASPAEGVPGQELRLVAPFFRGEVPGAPLSWLPLLFITVACGAISGFHCLVSSGTSSKQLKSETDAQFVGFGAMLTEGFLAVVVILACVAGLGLGVTQTERMTGISSGVRGYLGADGRNIQTWNYLVRIDENGGLIDSTVGQGLMPGETRETAAGLWDRVSDDNTTLTTTRTGTAAWDVRYRDWGSADGLAAKVGAFVDGAANFLKALGLPAGVAVALMGVLVASFAGTTLDTACRLQRYVVQELAGCLAPARGGGGFAEGSCSGCGYDLRGNVSGACPECGWPCEGATASSGRGQGRRLAGVGWVLGWLMRPWVAAGFAVLVAGAMAVLPVPGATALPGGCSLWHCLTPGAVITTDGPGGRPSHVGDHVMAGGFEAGWLWLTHYGGKGGMILWPMFGATNQLLGGLAFLVIGFWLLRRGKPVWFLVLPMVFMLVMPAWAMLAQLPGWWWAGLRGEPRNWTLIGIALATLALEAWMVAEGVLVWWGLKKGRGLE